ncbi:hypothetical protein ATANTOWER_029257 [Ataeniobius toweri]|uniref:Uncharacterized protein n=1 Tax=Ataeniobius toweri TaxID=208326 RepID=A0ABU7ACR7_9TELE|nr:hypothetical protein [Ataeniobius toweri]
MWVRSCNEPSIPAFISTTTHNPLVFFTTILLFPEEINSCFFFLHLLYHLQVVFFLCPLSCSLSGSTKPVFLSFRARLNSPKNRICSHALISIASTSQVSEEGFPASRSLYCHLLAITVIT